LRQIQTWFLNLSQLLCPVVTTLLEKREKVSKE
jgi:hypothetical protein